MAYNDNALIKIETKKTIKANYWALGQLSPHAFYIYCHLLNVNENFCPSVNAYVSIAATGIKRIRSALDELKDKGFLEITPIGYHKYQWVIRDVADKTKALFEVPKPIKKKIKEQQDLKEIDREIDELTELLESGELIDEVYEQVTTRLIELQTTKNKGEEE